MKRLPTPLSLLRNGCKKVFHFGVCNNAATIFVLAMVNEWKSFRHGADVIASYGLSIMDHLTVANIAKNVSYEVTKYLFYLIVSKCNRKTCRSLKFSKSFCIVASTTMTVRQTCFPMGSLPRRTIRCETSCSVLGTGTADGCNRNNTIVLWEKHSQTDAIFLLSLDLF